MCSYDDPMRKTIVFSNMLISLVPIFSTNKKINSVQRYVNEPCACVFMDDKHFWVSSCSFVPGSFENSANHSELLFAPSHVPSISPVKKEEDVRWHLPCLQSTEKILTAATAVWTATFYSKRNLEGEEWREG